MDNPLYEQEVSLRSAILLEPIGMAIENYYEMAPGREEQCEHFVAIKDHPSGTKVIGAATLFVDPDQDTPTGKVQQVCVDNQLQGSGIGRKLMISIEARGFGELGLSSLYCHAQLAAMPFYDRLGWETSGDEFIEAGIAHRRMFIAAPKPIESPSIP
jgi:predicted GNAT family N-acyltransferase